jgi:peroxiredoxin
MSDIYTETVRVGDRAPGFAIPAISRDGEVRLDDYTGRAPLLLNLFRGLHCPFCRRGMVQLTQASKALEGMGIETLAVVVTPRDRAQTYLRYRPTPLLFASDPDVATYRSYGVPMLTFTEDEDDWPRKVSGATMMATRVDANGDLAEPLPIPEASDALNRKDGYEVTEAENEAVNRHPTPLDGRFLIDRDGIVRWIHVEAQDGVSEFGKLPSIEAILDAGRSLVT